MTSNSLLDEIAKNLEQHENSNRIKKLIYCACTNTWENDQAHLDRFTFPELIQEVWNFHPTIEDLKYTLFAIVNTLNKRDEYSIIANFILKELATRYVINEEDTGIIVNQPQPEESTGIIFNQPQVQRSSNTTENVDNYQITYQVKYEYNPFDLRQNIIKFTNPLKAKLVLFSALEHPFSFNKEDWLKLKTQELDTLLWRLFDSCATFKELESKINSSISSLGNQEEDTQAAGAILQAMQNLYGDILADANQYQPVNSYLSEETQTLGNYNHPIASDDFNYISENDENNTCQLISPPNLYIRNNPQQE